MKINLRKAVNRFFSNPSFEMIYSEAMANALDANATVMSIDISIKSFEQPESMTIKIQDNGDGFSEENFLRFSSLMNTKDSSHKGLDRLVIGFAALESRVARLRKLHKGTHIRFEGIFRKRRLLTLSVFFAMLVATACQEHRSHRTHRKNFRNHTLLPF